MWKNQFLGQSKMTKIKAMTNMAGGIREKQLLFRLGTSFLNCQWHSDIKNRVFLKLTHSKFWVPVYENVP